MKRKKFSDKQVAKILTEKERKYWTACWYATLMLLEEKNLI